MRRPGSLLTLLLSILLAGVSAPVARGESIIEALAAADAYNPRLLAERARQRAELEKFPQARAGLLPTVTGTADYGREKTTDRMTGITGSGTPTTYGATLSQPLFDGFRAVNDMRGAQAEVSAGQETLDSVAAEVFLSTVQAYMDVYRDRKIEALRRDGVAIFRNELNQAEVRYRGGDITRTGVDQTRARLNESEADLAQADIDLARSEASYRAASGHHPGPLTPPSFVTGILPPSLEQAIRIAEGQNSRLRAAQFQYFAARHALSSARSAFSPTLSLDAAGRRANGVNDIGTEPRDASLKVRLSVPIFNGGRDLSKVAQAAAVRDQRQLQIEEARATMRQGIEASWEAIRGARQQLAASARRVSALDAANTGLMIEFNAGQIPIIQVLDGRRETITARVAQAAAERNQFYESFVLLAAVGRLSLDHPTLLAAPPPEAAATVARAAVVAKPAAQPGLLAKPAVRPRATTIKRNPSDPWYKIAAD
jgi:outer membrane protein